ncbi:MAG: paraquat-inducible protein A [Rhodocyclaceae bacterium]|nr:paraquat-inducible protein A [Rhodocyclaceae bacterium]
MTSVVACRVCGQVQRVGELPPGAAGECCRCGARLQASVAPRSPRATAALSLAALILYVPANALPILVMDMHGAHSESTIWEGCRDLFQDGQWLVAAIVFLASLLIPLLKLIGLFFLVVTTERRSTSWQFERARIFRIISAVGSWAMLDVFLMSVLVALVKLEQLATIRPGPALPAFAGVVTLTILACARFDPALIWPRRD